MSRPEYRETIEQAIAESGRFAEALHNLKIKGDQEVELFEQFMQRLGEAALAWAALRSYHARVVAPAISAILDSYDFLDGAIGSVTEGVDLQQVYGTPLAAALHHHGMLERGNTEIGEKHMAAAESLVVGAGEFEAFTRTTVAQAGDLIANTPVDATRQMIQNTELAGRLIEYHKSI